jgi:hypothetical protein
MTNLEIAIKAIDSEVFKPVNVQDVMKMAWVIAKDVARQYKVSSKALLSAALKKVWSRVLVKVSVFNAYNHRVFFAKKGFKFNKTNKAWEVIINKANLAFGTMTQQMLVSKQDITFSSSVYGV